VTDATETPTERYLVTMRSAFMLPDGSISTHEATDHVATADLDAYVADAQTRWQAVIVAEQPDAIDAAYTAPDIAPQEG
jgi:hypothetical protein